MQPRIRNLVLGFVANLSAPLAALTLLAAFVFLSGCQAPYLMKSAWSQADLLLSRESIESTLKSEKLSEEDRKKLELARDAKAFGERVLGLKKNANYASYVKLERPYVSYVVSAAEKDRLEQHLWSFPIVGDVPYKGFFNPDDAKAEASDLKKKGFDTYVRGVSAYSTLGWFDDPVLSSMLKYSDYDLVDTIIHESVHATLYIKSHADFNERLASFIGGVGADLFFVEREGPKSATVAAEKEENADEQNFSKFISAEIDALTKWYGEHAAQAKSADVKTHVAFDEARSLRLAEISKNYEKVLRPKIKSQRYAKILQRELDPAALNNARLLAWKLYVYDMTDFERVYKSLGQDPLKLIEFAKSLEKEDDPEGKLKALAAKAQ
jgi:predicted aminopeptidase